jgi:Cu+-exporting ATPase
MDLQDGQAQHATDPVCGMEVDPATAAGASEYEGTTYYFCSTGCKRQFDKDPQVFMDKAPQ